MAAYCAQADLIERFGIQELAELTDETAQATPDADEIAKACDEASSLIDGYVAAQYVLPLGSVPTILRKWACDIARFFIWKDRADPNSVVASNYAEAIKRLQDIAAGRSFLPDATGLEPTDGGQSIAVVAPCKIFTTDVLNAEPGAPYPTTGASLWRTFSPWLP